MIKKYFVIFTALFLAVYMGSYCFAADELSGNIENGIRIVEVKAFRYKFEPDPIVVKLADKVRLVVTSADVNHGMAISEFKVNVTIPAGKTSTVEFIADKKGVFNAYCSVYCGSGHGNMKGRFIVKE